MAERHQHAARNFGSNALADTRRDSVEFFREKIIRPCEIRRGLGGEKVNVRVANLHQPSTGFVVGVRGHAPEGFFADRPDPVDDLVEEPPAIFGEFGEHECREHAPPSEVNRFEFGAISRARNRERECCCERRPWIIEMCLGEFFGRRERFLIGAIFPCVAIGQRREWPPIFSRREHFRDAVRVGKRFAEDARMGAGRGRISANRRSGKNWHEKNQKN
ncbi:hypothetical protein Ga0100230_000615 [Opitutaceae bacterium TAV3]|nr:hypothetical protein Ga0100230_000615 [Opitutaceae bacterium TAV3]